MNKMSFSALLCVVLAAGPAMADSLVDGSAEAGKAKSITCAACHGAEGNSVNPTWPNLAGQHAGYIVEQLQAFKDGLRNNALMNGQAMMLSEEDMKNLSVYYEGLDAAAQPVADPDLIPRGKALYLGGDKDKGIAACIACHGTQGRGNAAAPYPALNGQHATYTAQTLRDYASGARKSGGKEQVMQSIAIRMTEDDIVAVSSYVQGLR